MKPLPRYIPIDYSKYAPDIADPEVKYGLPKEVIYCTDCVMSNQKPNSCQEFEHTKDSVKESMHISEDGVCDACLANRHKRDGNIDWNQREQELIELCNRYRRTDGRYDCLVPGSGGNGGNAGWGGGNAGNYCTRANPAPASGTPGRGGYGSNGGNGASGATLIYY